LGQISEKGNRRTQPTIQKSPQNRTSAFKKDLQESVIDPEHRHRRHGGRGSIQSGERLLKVTPQGAVTFTQGEGCHGKSGHKPRRTFRKEAVGVASCDMVPPRAGDENQRFGGAG